MTLLTTMGVASGFAPAGPPFPFLVSSAPLGRKPCDHASWSPATLVALICLRVENRVPAGSPVNIGQLAPGSPVMATFAVAGWPGLCPTQMPVSASVPAANMIHLVRMNNSRADSISRKQTR